VDIGPISQRRKRCVVKVRAPRRGARFQGTVTGREVEGGGGRDLAA